MARRPKSTDTVESNPARKKALYTKNGNGGVSELLKELWNARVASTKKDTEGVNKMGGDWRGPVRDLFTNARRAR